MMARIHRIPIISQTFGPDFDLPFLAGVFDFDDFLTAAFAFLAGVFFLDYITGDLTCLVIYPRTGKFGAKYTVNVVADLGIEQGKTPKYVMVTGGADFRAQNTGNLRPGGCVVYVADANTGAFVAYGMPWNNAFANTGRPQGGTFSRLGTGKARELDLDN